MIKTFALIIIALLLVGCSNDSDLTEVKIIKNFPYTNGWICANHNGTLFENISTKERFSRCGYYGEPGEMVRIRG